MERSMRFILRKSILLNTAWLRGQVSVAIPKLGITLPPAVPNWLQSPLKPRARLYMEVVTDRGDQQPRVDWNEIREWARSKVDSALKWNRVLVSASKVQWLELSQLSLCSEFDKENLIEFSLISLLLIHFTTMAMCLLSHGPHVTLVMWHTVTMTWPSITLLWHCDKVM